MKSLAVFISYRREDAAGYAGRLADSLRIALGERGEILRDVDSMIPPGTDFRQAIDEAIDRADVVLAVIGSRWLTVTTADGGRRLDAPGDVVRAEILAALESDVPLVPVLIEDAPMPGSGDLPPEISALSSRNAIQLTDARWSEDTDRLVNALRRLNNEAGAEVAAAIPRPAHPLLGRETELANVGDLLDKGTPLITLTGPGGIGKTTFAHVAAHTAAARFATVLYCDLTVIDDPDLVLPAIAREAGIDQPDSTKLVDSLGRAIGDSVTLLVLDNFEHVMAAGPAIAQLLAAAPGTTALVTSRAPLRVSGEQEFPIPPLPRSDATALFVERARAVRPDVDLTGEAVDAIAEICERLDGLPLAIELAAARVRMLTPRAIVTHLEKRLALLTDGARDRPERQQTVRATIDWSYQLLEEPDRALLARMSVFAGGASLEAIRAVCAPDEDEFEVLDRVQRLTENSLIVADSGPDGAQRSRMLELIRDFARERVANEGETGDLRRLHADYFASRARRFGPLLQGDDLAEGLEFFDSEYPNVTEALSWARGAGEGELELELLDWLGDYWYFRGFYAEPWTWFEHGLTVDGASPERRAAVLRGAGGLRVRKDDNAGARDLFVESLKIYEELGDKNGMIRALSGLEGCLARMGDYDLAEQAGAQAIELVRGLGDRRRLAFAISNAGYTAMQAGNMGDARTRFEEAVELAAEVGDAEATSLAHQNLGLLLVLEDELERAGKLTASGLSGAVALREHLGILAGLVAMAAIHARGGELEPSARLLGLIDAELKARAYTLDPIEQRLRDDTLEVVRAGLDPGRVDMALAAGAKLDLIEAAAAGARRASGAR